MRLFQLVAMVVVPVVGLVALSPSGAEAAPARAAKRATKKSATAAAPLPAPTAATLPQLPPVTRDVTAVTTLTPASKASASSSASAAGGATVTLTSGAPEGAALPTAETPPAARETVTVKENEIAETKPSGWVLQLGSGGLFPATSFVPGAKTLGPGVSFDVRLGYYPASHLGVLVGFRGSYGHELSGCGDSCSGYSLQVPVMLQFAAQDRTRGVYGEVGLGFGTTYGGTAGGATYSPSSPVEMKLGFGYRFAGSGGARRSTTLDLNVGMDIGSITSEDVHTADLSYSGKVDGATHVVVALPAIMHFSP
jgi:hypothetical protein